MNHTLQMYDALASWWPLISSPADYAEEAIIYLATLRGMVDPMQTVLELGSGGGNNASHMKQQVALTLVDRSPGMLAVSRALNPECEHLVGDMRHVRVGRTFDAVFIHDAVSYLTSEDELRATFETAWVHLRPGGAALFCPDWVVESFAPGTGHGGHDASPEDGRSLRYVEWVWDPDPADSTHLVDFAYIFCEADGQVRCVPDRHVFGLFPRATWLALLTEAGFEAYAVPFEHSEEPSGAFEMFVGIRSSQTQLSRSAR